MTRRTGAGVPAMGALLLLLGAWPAAAERQADRSAVPAAPARGLPDDQLAPQSVALLKAGEARLAKRETQAAADLFESALAADPRNRRAYLGLARAAEAEGLPGKAVRFYREALAIEPNDPVALELQGIALVERGAKARAESNLDRLRKLCTASCPSADRLAAAIARGPTQTAATVAIEERKP